jgi:hypothetical protein
VSHETTSTLRQLLNLKLGGRTDDGPLTPTLDERVRKLQADGNGFRLVARELTKETGVSVSGEILRRWYSEQAAS